MIPTQIIQPYWRLNPGPWWKLLRDSAHRGRISANYRDRQNLHPYARTKLSTTNYTDKANAVTTELWKLCRRHNVVIQSFNGNKDPPVRSPVVDEERMRPGHLLGRCALSSIQCYWHRWLADRKDNRPKETRSTNRRGSRLEQVKEKDPSESRLTQVHLEQEAQLSLRDRATRACQLKSGKVLHKCRRLVFEKLWN